MAEEVAVSETDKAQVLLSRELYKDPQARLAIEREAKRLYPKLPTPYLDQVSATEELRTVATDAKRSLDALAAERSTRALESDRAAIAKHGLTAADVPEVERVMAEGQIATHEAAAELVASRRRIAEVGRPRSAPSSMTIPGKIKDDFFDTSPAGVSIADDPSKWRQSRAYEMQAEFDRTRGMRG